MTQGVHVEVDLLPPVVPRLMNSFNYFNSELLTTVMVVSIVRAVCTVSC